jgi:hypothetical protein
MTEHDCSAGNIFIENGTETCSICGRVFPRGPNGKYLPEAFVPTYRTEA